MWGGVGLSPSENEFTLPGIAGGTAAKAYPTGVLAGVEAGYTIAPGPLSVSAVFDAAYDFSRSCVEMACVVGRKNGFLLQEGLEVGISLTTLGGYIPTSGQPQNWPVPITVPTSLWSNTVLALRGGYAERNLDLCAFVPTAVDITGATAGVNECGSKFIAAPFAGLKLKFMASAQSEIALRWDHVFWGNQYSFTPVFPAALADSFASTAAIKAEDIFAVGWNYHLGTGTGFLGF